MHLSAPCSWRRPGTEGTPHTHVLNPTGQQRTGSAEGPGANMGVQSRPTDSRFPPLWHFPEQVSWRPSSPVCQPQWAHLHGLADALYVLLGFLYPVLQVIENFSHLLNIFKHTYKRSRKESFKRDDSAERKRPLGWLNTRYRRRCLENPSGPLDSEAEGTECSLTSSAEG